MTRVYCDGADMVIFARSHQDPALFFIKTFY